MPISHEMLANFLVEAKKNTYASQKNETSVEPLFNGSKHFEYRVGNLLYRDIYVGLSFFVGQETVEFVNHPIWSMVYSGGVIDPNASLDTRASIYGFLRQALRLADTNSVYRGPNHYEDKEYIYKNEYEGTLNRFYGRELILANNEIVYELRYHGGMVR